MADDDLIAQGDRIPTTVAEARAEYLRLFAHDRKEITEAAGEVRRLGRRSRRILLAIAAALLVLGGVSTWLQFRQTADQGSNTRALCAFRADLEARVRQGSDFLAAHPNGIPGIPAVTLQVSIDAQRRTLSALTPVRCAPRRHAR